MKNIGVVIPAHNEEQQIEACLKALQQAQFYLRQHVVSPPVIKILLVLDKCSDNTEYHVKHHAIEYVCCDFGCVGKSRALGVQRLIDAGYEWIACTDADSQVSPHWFIAMLQHQPTDVICGVVEIQDWGDLHVAAQQQYLMHYQDRMHHRHIHGANLCFKSCCYSAVAGFQALSCHEDVDLIQRFLAVGCQITWSN